MALNVTVFYGSVRENRQGIKAAKFILNKCKERGYDLTFIDPLEWDLPLIDKMYKSYEEGEAPEKLKKLAGIIENSDGYIIVSGEYNNSIPPALTNTMDYFLEEYFFKPSAIACYSAGGFGGVRAAMQLRAFLAEIGCPSISSIFPMSMVQNSFDDDGNAKEQKYEKKIGRFLDEFEWYANAYKEARKNGTPY